MLGLLKKINNRLYELERRPQPRPPVKTAQERCREEVERRVADPENNASTPEAAEAQQKPGLVGGLMETVREFLDDDGMTQAAALAFYTGLSLAPLLTIAVWATQVFLGAEAKDQIAAVAAQVLGQQAAAPINQLLQPATEQAHLSMTISGLTSIILFAFTASGVFAQLQSSLNIMWNVEADPKQSGLWVFLRKRLFSFGMLLTILFLLMISMILSVGIEAFFGSYREDYRWIFATLNLGVSFVIATGIFALMFAYLPDARVPWRDTLIGAAITAALFLVGRWGLAIYLGRGSYETSYGAAVGSFVALLVWVYYTSIIIFIGTEATQVYARRSGHGVRPEEHAVRSKRIKKTVEPA